MADETIKLRSIPRYIKIFITNPKEFFTKFKRKLSVHDDFYRGLLKKGIVKYDRINKTYIRSVKGSYFHLNPKDQGLSRVIAINGIREKESVDALYEYVTPNMSILDIGANIGFYVILESQIVSRGSGRIIAVEAIPENVRFLRLNVEANNYQERVDIYTGAICEKTGTVLMALSPLSNCHQLAKLSNRTIIPNTIEVPAFTFADFLKQAGINMEQIDFLRMDIEGAEYEILSDIMNLLKKKTSFLMFIEFHPHVDEFKHIEVMKNLEILGFRCLTATKEYIGDNEIIREHRPDTTIKQLYSEKFFLQKGGCEVFLKRG